MTGNRRLSTGVLLAVIHDREMESKDWDMIWTFDGAIGISKTGTKMETALEFKPNSFED